MHRRRVQLYLPQWPALAHNRFRRSFVKTGTSLDGEASIRSLRVKVLLNRMNLPPSQVEDVNTVVHIRTLAIKQLRVGPPLDEHCGIPWPTRHPDLIDLYVKRREDTAHALEPLLHRLLSMSLTSQRMIPGNPVIRVWNQPFHGIVPAVVIDVVETLADRFLYDGTVDY
jgi:hypothetical protein